MGMFDSYKLNPYHNRSRPYSYLAIEHYVIFVFRLAMPYINAHIYRSSESENRLIQS